MANVRDKVNEKERCFVEEIQLFIAPKFWSEKKSRLRIYGLKRVTSPSHNSFKQAAKKIVFVLNRYFPKVWKLWGWSRLKRD